MIDMTELIHDPDFCTTFTVVRKLPGAWVQGEQTVQETTFPVEGIVLPSTSKDIEMLPEGDRRSGLKTFFADVELKVTDTETTADICVYKGCRYKLIHAFDYEANGFYKAIGTLAGDA